MKQQIFKNPFVWVVALLLLGGAGYGAVTFGIIDLSRFTNVVPSESAEFAARVNGEGIQASLLQLRFDQTKKSYEARGARLEEKDGESLRQQVLENMINELLLLQYGRTQGLTAGEEMIETEYQQIVAQFPSQEEFQKYLATQGATPEDVRSTISVQLIVQQIIDRQTAERPIEISEEEMRQVYDQAVKNGTEAPPFEEAKEDIENQLRQQKIGQLMNTLIAQLRVQGTIELFDKTAKGS